MFAEFNYIYYDDYKNWLLFNTEDYNKCNGAAVNYE